MKNIQGLDSICNLLPCTTAGASSLRTVYVITYLVLCLLDAAGTHIYLARHEYTERQSCQHVCKVKQRTIGLLLPH